jgi:transposase
MFIDSKYTKSFHSKDLTETKYSELFKLATTINNHKNEVSLIVSNNLPYFLELTKFDFMKYFRSLFPDTLSSNFDAQTYIDVFTSYQNKFEAIQKKLVFNLSKPNEVQYYLKNTKWNKKGDSKKLTYTKYKTRLTSILSYLARYGNEKTLDYINNQLLNSKLSTSLKELYNDAITYSNKYGFDRLLSLALTKRKNTYRKYSIPIVFKSLTFRGRSRKGKIVDYNKKFGSKINSFISLSFSKERKTIDIPIKFNKEYHGKIKDYLKKTNNYEYVLKFNDRKKEVIINICKDGKRYIPEVTDNDPLVGIDVNFKHNVFSLSNGDTYDFNRQLLKDYTKLMSSIKKTNDIGRRKQHKINTLSNKMLKDLQNIISNMCKDLQDKGIKHIVMEDLNNGFGKSFVGMKDYDQINFNRIVKFLKLSSLKDEVEHISRKYDIVVSLVHKEYTSQGCSFCGEIHEDNRKSQEEFECIRCGHSENADFNASKNIVKRVSEAVQRDLLKKIDNGGWQPKILERIKVKEKLLSFRLSDEEICYREVLNTFI